jgi:hypothetical protein
MAETLMAIEDYPIQREYKHLKEKATVLIKRNA